MDARYGVLFFGTALSLLLSALVQRRNRAVCVISTEHSNGVSGKITLTALSERTLAECDLSGLPPGFHGLHVHNKADFSKGCASTCSHYNPTNSDHGGPTGPNRHKGDFGNIYADALGRCTTTVVADVELDRIRNRAFIVHEGEDDLGRGGDAESLKTGNAGARLACGKIV